MSDLRDPANEPFALLGAQNSREVGIVDGHYDPESQQWTGVDYMSTTTWCRSSTTGWFDQKDPDEDKDD